MRSTRFSAAAIVIAAVISVSLAGCTPSDGPAAPSGTTAVNVDKALAAAVPDDVRKGGSITVATDPTYAPFESLSNGKVVGLDADLANAIGSTLNLKVKFKQTSFDAIIPALQAKDADMALSSIGDSKEREKVVDFATAYWNGTLLLVKKGNPKKGTPALACDMTIGVVRGSLQQTDFLPAQDQKCQADGKKPPVANVFPTSQQAALALQSSRVDGVLADAPTVTQTQASDPSLEAAGPIVRNPNPAGIAFPKNSRLVTPVQGAINNLIDDGVYAKILKKYKLSSIEIQESKINGAVQ